MDFITANGLVNALEHVLFFFPSSSLKEKGRGGSSFDLGDR